MPNRVVALPMPFWARFAGLRDRLLTNPRFVSWASAFPLTRFVARKRAASLFDLCAGFVYSQILFACVELRLFDMLRANPLTVDEIARRAKLPEDSAIRLLQGAKALNLVEARAGGVYGLGPLGAAIVADPGIAAMVKHHAHLYADLTDPVALLRGEADGTALSKYWGYALAGNPAAMSGEEVADYSALMALSLPIVAEEVLEAYPIARHRRLLDIGGGEGGFLAAAGARAPDLDLTLFDLPAVAELGRRRLAGEGLGNRVQVFGGDFLTDPLPEGADLISLIRVILDHDDGTALRILSAARAALAPGGTLLLAEPLADMPGAETMGSAYFGLYLKAMGRGRARTYGELKHLLTEAGFGRIALRTGRRVLRTGIVTARPQA
jgi:demethylspheroidene O-methyltransferase